MGWSLHYKPLLLSQIQWLMLLTCVIGSSSCFFMMCKHCRQGKELIQNLKKKSYFKKKHDHKWNRESFKTVIEALNYWVSTENKIQLLVMQKYRKQDLPLKTSRVYIKTCWTTSTFPINAQKHQNPMSSRTYPHTQLADPASTRTPTTSGQQCTTSSWKSAVFTPPKCGFPPTLPHITTTRFIAFNPQQNDESPVGKISETMTETRWLEVADLSHRRTGAQDMNGYQRFLTC